MKLGLTIKSIVFIICTMILSGCISFKKEHILVLDYRDFGPQAMATPLLGKEWWQWQSHGDSTPTFYDIKVVVYDQTPLKDVKEKFAVEPEKEKDYRYIKYKDAMEYLDKNIESNILITITPQLQKTRERLTSFFGTANQK